MECSWFAYSPITKNIEIVPGEGEQQDERIGFRRERERKLY